MANSPHVSSRLLIFAHIRSHLFTWLEVVYCGVVLKNKVSLNQDRIRNKMAVSLNEDLKQHFNTKVLKIPLETRTTCPTRDGTKGARGCFYCSSEGSFYGKRFTSITEQIHSIKTSKLRSYPKAKFIAYFQSYTPTYTECDVLRSQYEESLSDPDIVGISVCTRPDCLPDTVLDVMADTILNRYHWLELGLQSSHDHTLTAIGRGHTYADFLDAFMRAKQRGFRIAVHLILGLPGEGLNEMRLTIERLVALGVDGFKFHHLHILRGSVFEEMYRNGEIKVMELAGYSELLAELMPLIPQYVVIHRLIGDAPKDILIAPKWSLSKLRALQAISRVLKNH